MKYIIVSFLLVLFFSCCSETPTGTNKIEKEIANNLDSINKNIGLLIDKLKNADSVVLVSHIDHTLNVLADGDVEAISRQPLVINSLPNNRIIKERRVINSSSLDTLVKILLLNSNDDSFEKASCYMPHHTIFLFKENDLSYIDFCFQCQRFETSKDLLNAIVDIGNQKMEKIRLFYKSLGFNYKLDFNE